MVICLERWADLHMAQLMPLPLTVSCSNKIQVGFIFLVPAHLGSPGQRAVKRVCVYISTDRQVTQKHNVSSHIYCMGRHTQPFNGPLFRTTGGLVPQNIHPLKPILNMKHPLSISSINYNPQQPPCSIYMLDSPFPQPLSPLDLGPSTSYSIHFFTQSPSCFLSTCQYHRSLFCCNTKSIF